MVAGITVVAVAAVVVVVATAVAAVVVVAVVVVAWAVPGPAEEAAGQCLGEARGSGGASGVYSPAPEAAVPNKRMNKRTKTCLVSTISKL